MTFSKHGGALTGNSAKCGDCFVLRAETERLELAHADAVDCLRMIGEDEGLSQMLELQQLVFETGLDFRVAVRVFQSHQQLHRGEG